MNKTKIEWVKNPDGSGGYTWNPVTGCLHGCSYCYARKIALTRFNDDFRPKYHQDRYLDAVRLKKPSTIFVCSMADLFGDWIDKKEIMKISFDIRHTYIFLTKNPKKYKEWELLIGPQKNWFGITLEDFGNQLHTQERAKVFLDVLKSDHEIHSFISFEPLLYNSYWNKEVIELIKRVDWVIIGALTNNNESKHTVDFKDAITDILNIKPDIKLFVKDNVYKLYPDIPRIPEYRQLPYFEVLIID